MEKEKSYETWNKLTRREFLKSSIAVGVATGVSLSIPKVVGAAKEEIVMITYGGAYQTFFLQYLRKLLKRGTRAL